jgi:hypothetical protein
MGKLFACEVYRVEASIGGDIRSTTVRACDDSEAFERGLLKLFGAKASMAVQRWVLVGNTHSSARGKPYYRNTFTRWGEISGGKACGFAVVRSYHVN